MKIRHFLLFIMLLLIGCEDNLEEKDADIIISNHTIETNQYTGTHKILIDYVLTNIGTATITGWDITFSISYINEERSFVGHTANPFHRSTFKIKPGDTTEIITLRREITSDEVIDVQLFEIILK